MKNNAYKLSLSALMLMGLLCHVADAQQDSGKAQGKAVIDPKTITRITLGTITGIPGTVVLVPVYFTPAEGVDVGSVKLEVNFVSANLKFEKIERGLAAETGNVDLSAKVKEDKNENGVDTSTVTIQASLPNSAIPKKGIPGGLLAHMLLRISETGRPANITLRTVFEAAELGTTNPLKNVRSFDAQVEVVAPGSQPAVACFFFSH